MMVNMTLSVLVRAGIKLGTSRKWAWDDTIITLAAVSMRRKHLVVLKYSL
jgi:hypothetical protein